MAKIKNELNNIKSALYGKDVRNSIHDGIDAINKEVESTTGRQVDLENTFDQLVINAGNSNAEIVDARVKSDGTSYSKLGDRLNEVDSQLAHNVKIVTPEQFGAKGDGVTDDRPFIITAINELKKYGGGTLRLKTGATYLLGGFDEGLTIISCISNLTIEGFATFKVKSNLGDYRHLFNFQGCKNVTFKDFTVDENTVGNPKTESTGLDRARITFASWHAESYNISFENITINDCIGVWQITFGDNGHRIRNVSIKNCKINYNTENINLSYDRTSLYLGGSNVVVEGCEFNAGDTIKNANTCIEFHGDNIRVKDNKIINYNAGMFICNDTECVDKNTNLVAHNNYILANTGILLWFEFENRNVDVVNITNNYIEFTKKGIGTYDIHGHNSIFRNINIEKNTLISKGDSTSLPISFSEHLNNELNSEYNNVNILNNNVYANVQYFVNFEAQPNSNLHFKNFRFEKNYFKSTESNLIRVMQRGDIKNILFYDNVFDVGIINRISIAGSDSRAVTLKDNIINNITIEKLLADRPIKVVTELNNFDFIYTKYIQNYTNKFIDGSIFKGDNVTLEILTIDGKQRLINTGRVATIPKRCFLDKGSRIFLLDECVEKVVTKEGYLADKTLASGIENKKGEWVKYGLYVMETKVDNTSTDGNDTSLFTYIGESAVLK